MTILFPKVFEEIRDFYESDDTNLKHLNKWCNGLQAELTTSPVDCVTYYFVIKDNNYIGPYSTLDIMYDRLVLSTVDHTNYGIDLLPFMNGYTEEVLFQYNVAYNMYGITEEELQLVCKIAKTLDIPDPTSTAYKDLQKYLR